MDLPPGFRFHPTDEELITHYLCQKVAGNSFSQAVIGELDMNKCEPWDLPSRSRLGEEWYFFCIRDKKYSTGLRTNRATEAGYWKATGKDKEIHKRKILIGMRKTLVFYRGRAPNGEKTKWVMHEYRLEGKQSEKIVQNEWVICRIFCRGSDEKGFTGVIKMRSYRGHGINSSSAVVPLVDVGYSNKERLVSEDNHVTCFSNILESQKAFDELFSSSYNSPFLSIDDVSWSSLNPSKMALQGSLWAGQAPRSVLNSQQQGAPMFQKGDNTTIKKEGLGLSEETWMNSGLQSAISAASANCHIGGCLFDYQDSLTAPNQVLHLDGWTLNC